MANPDLLPQEILVEIFSRLPAKSAGKCKLLSKQWNNYLSTSHFIKLHQICQSNQQNNIIVNVFESLHLVTPSIINDNNLRFSSEIQPIGNTRTTLLGSCNGLILLLKKGKKMFVVNPITRKQVQIPNPPSLLTEHSAIILYGFGYDLSSDDFKIVKITFHGNQNHVDVYSMKRLVWKTLVVDYPFGFRNNVMRVMTFVHGAMHWSTTMDHSMNIDRICAFDLATESFHEIALPKDLTPSYAFNELVVIRGCLANIGIFSFGTVADVWVMNEYGVRDSWVRFHIHDNFMPDSSIVQLVCLVGDGEMLCITGKKCWGVYDLKEGMWKKKVDGPNPGPFIRCMVLEERLVSPE